MGVPESGGCRIMPPDVISKYGDMKDWKNVVGTGPYMITDVVPSSFITFERNPDYWQNDPMHPDLQNPPALYRPDYAYRNTRFPRCRWRRCVAARAHCMERKNFHCPWHITSEKPTLNWVFHG